MYGRDVTDAIEKGLKDAGIDGRVMEIGFESRTRSMPITSLGSGSMIIDRVVTGTDTTLTIKMSVNGITVVKNQAVSFKDMEFVVQPRAIAKAGEDV